MKRISLLVEIKKVNYIGEILLSIVSGYIGVLCRNFYNYMNKILGMWIGVYDNVKCM